MRGGGWRSAFLAALLVTASPSVAAGVASATISSSLSQTVDNYYARQGQGPIWLRYGASSIAASRFVELLRNADLDGLEDGPALAREAEQAMDEARSGEEQAMERADRLLSAAWVRYVQALNTPTTGVLYADPAVVPRSPRTDQILRAAAEAPSLAQHVAKVAAVNPFYAELRRAAVSEDLADSDRAKVRANLERARLMPSGGRFILVDVASARLTMVEDGRVADSMKVVVGKSELKTPLIASRVMKATFNPYWNVPVDLVQHNIAPKVLSEGLSYLTDRRYEVLSSWDDDAVAVDPQSIDWQAAADGKVEVRVRQLPGPENMMGEMKFTFPNGRGIYLHDTPDKSLFDKEQRLFSSGCVRLEDARRLGRWLLGREPVAPSDNPEVSVALAEPVPVYVTYFTARPEDGRVAFTDDVYGLDGGAGPRIAAR